jgi:photosystem II stability/assembly factor-like uncharacterized protein
MKAKFYTIMILTFFSIAGYCQFTPVSINFQPSSYGNYPEYVSITDASHIWLGNRRGDSVSQVPYTYAVHTSDGGSTWQFDSIPAPGDPIISSIFAVDANTCYYTFTDYGLGGSIWKTSDGGATWANKTVNHFNEPGAFANFYCAFSASEGVALGDPTLGYFELLRTTNGGDTWSRVDSSLIPSVFPGEMGATHVFSSVGDIIWFASLIGDVNGTYSSRVFKSVDRGQHWTVSPIVADNLSWAALQFSSPMNGVLYDGGYNGPIHKFYRTADGGSTWTVDSVTFTTDIYFAMSSVPGFDGGFVVATNDAPAGTYDTKVLFTPDFFNTIVVLDSILQANPWGIKFHDASTGWMEGNGTNAIAMHKFSGLLTSVSEAAKTSEKLAIIPNPTSTEALVKLPGMNEQGDLTLMIYDVTGKLRENRKIETNTGWTKLSASAYGNGVYVVQVVSGDRVIAGTKWVVQH